MTATQEQVAGADQARVVRAGQARVLREARARRRVGHVAIYVVLGVMAALTVMPLLYAFFASFKPVEDILVDGARLLPREWTLENYRIAWELGGFDQYFQNSLFVVIGVITLDLLFSSMLGFVLARKLVPFGNTIAMVMGGSLFLGMGTATLYPRLVIAQQLGIDNLVGVVLLEFSGMTVIHTFLIRAFVTTLPAELEDAARVDGCGIWRAYWMIAFPLMRPILTTTTILAFQASWNAFQLPYVFTLNDPEMRTLVVGVYALRATEDGSQAYDLILAGAMLIIVPIVILFAFLQRYFLRGLTEGSVKG
ncbi:carbohydrate ABC transporter permease [Ruania rhizosphaerae]|uniref:carbohydrate ABC transporter permease n=1 Tax=Ruania rhizosphaerae TaxID=1840413 RepID=UPI001356D3CB|nr:carbohydrate ABC transporter permease [Ruania rhizosphaerae]